MSKIERANAAGLADVKIQSLAPAAENTPTVLNTVQNRDSRLIHPDMIDPDPDQPRETFDEEDIAEMGESLDPKTGPGQLQEVRVYLDEQTKRFRLIFGERRWRGAKLKGIELRCQVVPAPLNKTAKTIMQLGENDHRTDLNFIERGNKYRELMNDNNWTQAELAKRVNRSPSQISMALSVEANCPEELKAAVVAETVTERGAYAVSQITDADVRAENAKELIDGTKTVEEVRAAAQENPRSPRGRPKRKPVDTTVTPLQTARSCLAQLLESIKHLSAKKLPAFIAEAHAALTAASEKAA